MLILALDTATPSTTVAVTREGELLGESSHVDPRKHAELLTPTIDALLRSADVELSAVSDIVVGVGPGAFTGLRVGLATARALGQALRIPVHGMVTLDALACEAGLTSPFAVVMDARRKQVFWAQYADAATRTSGPFVADPGEVQRRTTGMPVVGAAATPFADLFAASLGPRYPSAGALGLLAHRRLAAGELLLLPEPLYLRHPDVTPSVTPKSVLS